jgi:hypothetical protein
MICTAILAAGSVIPAARLPLASGNKSASSPPEITYSVSLAAGVRVMAAALQVDGQYFIDAVSPLIEK